MRDLLVLFHLLCAGFLQCCKEAHKFEQLHNRLYLSAPDTGPSEIKVWAGGMTVYLPSEGREAGCFVPLPPESGSLLSGVLPASFGLWAHLWTRCGPCRCVYTSPVWSPLPVGRRLNGLEGSSHSEDSVLTGDIRSSHSEALGGRALAGLCSVAVTPLHFLLAFSLLLSASPLPTSFLPSLSRPPLPNRRTPSLLVSPSILISSAVSSGSATCPEHSP